MPQRKRSSNIPESGRATRSKSKHLVHKKSEFEELTKLSHNNKQNYHANSNGQTSNNPVINLAENGCKLTNGTDSNTSNTSLHKQNGNLTTTFDNDEKQFPASLPKYTMECLLYIYICLTWSYHNFITLNKNSSHKVMVNYVIGGQITCSLMFGMLADIVSVKATCVLKILLWVACLVSSFTIHEDITEILSRLLLCSSLLVSQIALCHGKHNCAGALARLTAIRCLLDYYRLGAISIIERMRALLWDVGSYYGHFSSERLLDQLLVLLLTSGAVIILLYVSTNSSSKSNKCRQEIKGSFVKYIIVVLVCKLCVTIPSVSFLFNRNSFQSSYVNAIYSFVIGIQLLLFPLLSCAFSAHALTKFSFILLAAVYTCLVYLFAHPTAQVALLAGAATIAQCSILSRVTTVKRPGITLSLLAISHLFVRLLGCSLDQPIIVYFLQQVPVHTLWSGLSENLAINLTGVILSVIGFLVSYLC